jgi:hypothetical protein
LTPKTASSETITAVTTAPQIIPIDAHRPKIQIGIVHDRLRSRERNQGLSLKLPRVFMSFSCNIFHMGDIFLRSTKKVRRDTEVFAMVTNLPLLHRTQICR